MTPAANTNATKLSRLGDVGSVDDRSWIVFLLSVFGLLGGKVVSVPFFGDPGVGYLSDLVDCGGCVLDSHHRFHRIQPPGSRRRPLSRSVEQRDQSDRLRWFSPEQLSNAAGLPCHPLSMWDIAEVGVRRCPTLDSTSDHRSSCACATRTENLPHHDVPGHHSMRRSCGQLLRAAGMRGTASRIAVQ